MYEATIGTLDIRINDLEGIKDSHGS